MTEKTYKNFKGGLKTRAEFREFIPPMSKDAFELLTENIKNDGYIRDPLVVWNDVILDGHHRYKIAESLDMSFEVRKETFKSDNDAKLWMLNNQIGSRRMSTSQLAVFALAYIPIYAELCKNRQKQGGKDKENMGKGVKTTELAAKQMGINGKIVVDIKYLKDNLPEIIPLIKNLDYEGLTVHEARSLKRQRDNSSISIIVADGKLSEEAETALNKMREKTAPKTAIERAVGAAQTAVNTAKLAVTKAKEINPESEETLIAVAEHKKAVDCAKETTEAAELVANATSSASKKIATDAAKIASGNAKTAAKAANDAAAKVVKPITPNSDGDTNSTDENKSSVFTNTDKVIEGDRLKRYINDLKEAIQIKFGEVSCMAKMDDTEKQVVEIVNNIADGVETGYNENMVLIVPTNQTHAKWFQKASGLANFFCDSSEHPVRLLYFGNDDFAYWNELSKYGITCSSMFPKLEGLNPQAEIEELTPPKTALTVARAGKKSTKKPLTAEELLKRVKAKKATKKTKR